MNQKTYSLNTIPTFAMFNFFEKTDIKDSNPTSGTQDTHVEEC